MTQLKRCCHCEKMLAVVEFTSAKLKPDGLSSSCKACKREYDARRYAAKREKLLAQHKTWRRANGERIREYRDQWRAVNLEHVKAVQRAYDQRNADKIRARKAARRTALREINL
ncbi:hypothetical protein [Paraburkholderia bannensis]|uniref:hypothetical protein n=1 Tax=Paraburkholderia bannensis TaxID=765414 RepID=UPI0012EC19EB|nr:hypothetical protein [Paraburkholderia bannensis]